MWELIGKLDAEVDLVFEDQRSREYPLWETLASTYRQRIVELKRQLNSSPDDGKPGDDASQQQESSPPTPEPSSSGTTQQQPTSSSTGTTERNNGDWTD
jgi:hypothetical protein